MANSGSVSRAELCEAMSKLMRSWSKGVKGHMVINKLSRTTRIKVMKAAVVPVLTAFCKTRAWTEHDLKQVEMVEKKALRAAFGITMWDVREYRIRHEKLYKAAGWTPIDKVIKRETLRWMGHVARMKKDRLLKIALFGWRKGIDQEAWWPSQARWMKNVLKEAGIPEMDWFRAAQSKGPGGQWQWMIDRAFLNTACPKTTREN